jgi:hypothetical protein
MPGMGMNSGLSQSEFTTQTNSGPIGAFSADGTQPYGGMQMTLDGASLADIGNQGTQIANVNQDTTAEFTYLNAAFGADTLPGPTISRSPSVRTSSSAPRPSTSSTMLCRSSVSATTSSCRWAASAPAQIVLKQHATAAAPTPTCKPPVLRNTRPDAAS